MRWLIAALYILRHRELVAAEGIPLHHAPDVVDIACPGRGQPYLADLAPEDDAPDLRRWRGRRRSGCGRHAPTTLTTWTWTERDDRPAQ